jgi:2-(1,2-epoxy-1,2-dihydrophenyl)acetyl-CoA isomerase
MAGYEGIDGLQVSLSEGVLRLRIDRMAKRNALTDVIVAGLIAAVDQAERDEAVRVIVLSGEGEHFCSGFDWVGRNDPSSGARPRAGSMQRRLPKEAHRLIPLLVSVQTPIVCRVQGWAAGIGLHLVLASDIAVAADDARLWAPFTERGFTPDSGGTWLLPRRVGEVRAREMLLLGRTVTGAEAASWGLVHAAVGGDQLDAAVEDVVARLAAAPTVAVGLTKWLLHAGTTASLDEHLRNEAFAMEVSARSEDFREGLAAFKEKRPPRFRGR